MRWCWTLLIVCVFVDVGNWTIADRISPTSVWLILPSKSIMSHNNVPEIHIPGYTLGELSQHIPVTRLRPCLPPLTREKTIFSSLVTQFSFNFSISVKQRLLLSFEDGGILHYIISFINNCIKSCEPGECHGFILRKLY